MSGKWHPIVIAASLGVYVALKGFSIWLLFVIVFLGYYCFLQKEKGRFFFVICLSSFCIFFLYTLLFDHLNHSQFDGSESQVIGVISSIPNIDGNFLSFQLKVDKERLQVNYYLKTIEEKQQLQNLTYGMKCKIEGQLKMPNEPTNFYAFDYQKYLYYQKIHWVFYPKSIEISRCHPPKKNPFTFLQQLRIHGIKQIEEHFPEELKGISAALIYGDRQNIEDEVLDAYQSLGVIHLLAVSGLHVGLIVSALFYILLRMGITKERVYEILLVILPIYMILAGASPSVVRATLMTMVVLFCLRLKMRIHPLDGICYVYLAYLFISPYVLFHIGFQLSFLISFSLIISSQSIFAHLSGYLKSLLAVTIQSQFFSLPIIFFHFYEFSLLSFPLNMVYIPFISVIILPSVFIVFFLMLILPNIASLFANILEKMLAFAHRVLLYFDQLQVGTITLGKITELQAIFMFIIVVFGCYQFEKRRRLQDLIVPTVLFALLIAAIKMAPYLTPTGEVTFLDVGQGDSILIELPYRKAVYLIDTGGKMDFNEEEWKKRNHQFEVGQDIVVPYLKAKGITKIDRLILTHGDYDHIGGAFNVAQELKIKETLYSYGEVEESFEKQLLQTLADRGSKIRFVKEGETWQIGKHDFYILSPMGNEETTNGRSIVIYARIGGVNWLFTGDLEDEGERRLINTYKHLSVDILKAGHHGSRTSSSPQFLDHIRPKIVVISAGRNNRFGHPHREVLQAFFERKMRIYRTDENGAIRFIFSNDQMKKVETAL